MSNDPKRKDEWPMEDAIDLAIRLVDQGWLGEMSDLENWMDAMDRVKKIIKNLEK